MKRFLVLALLASSIPLTASTAAPSVEIADANWSYLPAMKQHSNDHLSNKAISRIYEIAREGKCTFADARKGLLDFDMSFAAQFNPDGSLNRIVMPRLGCPEAEGVLGGILLQMVQKGDYRQDGSNQEGWYRGELSFTVGG